MQQRRLGSRYELRQLSATRLKCATAIAVFSPQQVWPLHAPLSAAVGRAAPGPGHHQRSELAKGCGEPRPARHASRPRGRHRGPLRMRAGPYRMRAEPAGEPPVCPDGKTRGRGGWEETNRPPGRAVCFCPTTIRRRVIRRLVGEQDESRGDAELYLRRRARPDTRNRIREQKGNSTTSTFTGMKRSSNARMQGCFSL